MLYSYPKKGKLSLFAFIAIDETTGKRTIFWHRGTALIESKEIDKSFITSCSLLHLDHRNPEAAVLTFGDRGCLVKTREEEFFQPALKVKVVDTTGAGDVFRGAFAYGIFKKWPLRKTAQIAAIAAGLKCTKVGGRSGIPTLKEVSAFIRQHHPFSLSSL